MSLSNQPVSEFIGVLETAGAAAALWDQNGKPLECTSTLLTWCGGACHELAELVPYAPDQIGAAIGKEFELTIGEEKRWVLLRVGRHGASYFGLFHDIQERYRLIQEVNNKTAALEEKVWELSRSKRAILNILEDLEERSRELSKGKEELEILNENLQRFNRDLERANKDLRSLDEVKSNLLSNVSHELRTPLVAIKGYSELIYRGKLGPITEKQKAGLEISLKSLARLIDLINNLLDFSRIEIGKLQLEVTDFLVKDLLPEVLGIVVPMASERGIVVETRLSDNGVRYKGDRNKIAQVLTNLLTNAVKFNNDHGRVTLSVEGGNDEIVMRVIDTGIGIPPEQVGRIFDRFFQIDSSITRHQDGAGIGLSIVKSLVELHGGSIQVVSQPGEGSTFFVRLPQLPAR